MSTNLRLILNDDAKILSNFTHKHSQKIQNIQKPIFKICESQNANKSTIKINKIAKAILFTFVKKPKKHRLKFLKTNLNVFNKKWDIFKIFKDLNVHNDTVAYIMQERKEKEPVIRRNVVLLKNRQVVRVPLFLKCLKAIKILRVILNNINTSVIILFFFTVLAMC